MNTLIPGAPLRSLSPTSIEYQRAQGASRAAKPVRAARFTLDAPDHSGTIPGAIGDILPPGVALTSNLAVIFTLNQYRYGLTCAQSTGISYLSRFLTLRQARSRPRHVQKYKRTQDRLAGTFRIHPGRIRTGR